MIEAVYEYSDWTPRQAAEAFARSFPEPRAKRDIQPISETSFGFTFRLVGGRHTYRVRWEQQKRGYVIARLTV